MTRVVLLLIFFICCSTGGEIVMTHGMKRVGEPVNLRPGAILRFLGRAVRSAWLWFALPLLAASFYSLLVLLSWAPLSVVIPASAFNYVVGTFGAKYLLKEQVSTKRWAGVIMVCIGVALVLVTSGDNR
jgi:drug/metabolite transporter (DMT)-like permease